MIDGNLVFLKLGGSLITDKKKPHSARLDHIGRLAAEIKHALRQRPGMKLVIGHGSGSFGHIAARAHGTREGVFSLPQWQGFVEVWREARALNQIIVEQLADADLPVIAFPPSATLISKQHSTSAWFTQPITRALNAGLIPLINGDVVFDEKIGATIFSTEELFQALAENLTPSAVLLAGIEEGVYRDYENSQHLIKIITPATFQAIRQYLDGSTAVDVTGGMLQKVEILLQMVEKFPQCYGQIFSGIVPGNLVKALSGEKIGTLLRSE